VLAQRESTEVDRIEVEIEKLREQLGQKMTYQMKA
jgi:hypothetical protein